MSELSTIGTPALWVAFSSIVLVLLGADLYILHRDSRELSFKESLLWSALWAGLALLFCFGIFQFCGSEPALQFLTGYVIEEALSVDNLFVFLVIFSFFSVPKSYQRQVLFYGILGAMVSRGIFILIGAALFAHFAWAMYLFGAILLIAAVRFLFHEGSEADISSNIVVRLTRKFLPLASSYHGGRFFMRIDKKVYATPLLLTLIVIEVSDIMFALDSIPAVFAVTRDPFIVFTSNIFAIFGLRALYFVVAGALKQLRYLHYGLAAILTFIGAKMLLRGVIEISTGITLVVIFSTLVITMLCSRVSERNPSAK